MLSEILAPLFEKGWCFDKNYSYFKESTGLVKPALMDWKEMVASPINSTIIPEKINIKTFISSR